MKPFHFYWNEFDALAGLKYVIGIVVLTILSKWIQFPLFVMGISALLVWLLDILGGSKERLLMIVLYLIVGTFLTWLSLELADNYWAWALFIFSVTFIGTLILRWGMQWFMLGWTLIYWFMLAPVLYTMGNPQEMIWSHILGSSVVLVLVLLELAWKYFKNEAKGSKPKEPEQKQPYVPWRVTLPYAFIVATVMTVGLMLGYKYLSTDATMISNSAFMIIGFNMTTTWKAGLERMIAALLGVVIGFYLGVALQSEEFGMIFTVTVSFFVLAFLKVNNGAVIFLFVVILAYGWGLQDFETGNRIANERIMAEFIGVILAGVAISILYLLSRTVKGVDTG